VQYKSGAKPGKMRGYMRFLSRTLIYRGNAAILEDRAF
jgi:hypothetical protein